MDTAGVTLDYFATLLLLALCIQYAYLPFCYKCDVLGASLK